MRRLRWIFLTLFSLLLVAQGQTAVTLTVVDSSDGMPLPGAIVKMMAGQREYKGATDVKGVLALQRVMPGEYLVRATYVGYQPYERRVQVTPEQHTFTLKLQVSTDELQEVVVTAKPSKGMVTSSLIGREAMTLLQPSSIGDVLELLPGGFSSDPLLTSPDIVRLREATLPIVGQHNLLPRVNQSQYNTSSMGTRFLIDGVPVQMDAGLKGMYGSDGAYSTQVPINAGVDMRSISTDDVESIEVVQGIPSVEHSDLTSGLIKVKRKQWTDELTGRFKSDMSSKLFFLSKGVDLLPDRLNLISSIGYLSAYSDPRSVRDCYERITGSLRLSGRWSGTIGSLSSLSSIDYTGSLNDRKRDQDLDVTPLDTYQSGNHRLALSESLSFLPTENPWLSAVDLTLSLSHTWDRTAITKDMLMSRDVPYLTTREEGEHEGRYYPRTYFASHTVDSRPLYLYLKLKGSSRLDLGLSRHRLKYGADWSYSKNIGRGAIFDLDRPLFWLSGSRPRPFYDVPGKSVLSLFVEDEMTLPIQEHALTLMAGVVANSLLALDRSYRMSGRWYPDIRLNARWSFAPIEVAGRPLMVRVNGGVGSLSMFPSMEQLYPDTIYDDFVELNYYHSNPDYRLVYMRTYIYDPDNKQLAPAKNVKGELRLDLDYAGYSATLTCFRERMRSGFRKDTELRIADFRYYDPQSVDYATLTAKPDIRDFKYRDTRDFRLLPLDTNGSETDKSGVEWVMSTPRYRFLNTRVTLSGAWFRTTYRNSLPQYERPRAVLGGREVPYVGIYQDNEILVREILNTDLRLDNYLPKIGLGLSLSFQSNWFSSSQKMPLSNYPDYFISLSDGERRPFTAADKGDAQLQWLKRTYTESSFERYVVPFMMITNLKATKSLFENKLRVALFVNKIFDYSPDIERKGFVIRRNQTPYFGMEMMINL